jgi:hypothetical protein
MLMKKTVFISADHGLAIVYFLQSAIISTLLDAGVLVVLLTDDALKDKINERFGREGLVIDGLRFDAARKYERTYRPGLQWWLAFLRRAGASNRINLEAVDSYIAQVEDEAHPRRKRLFPVMHVFVWFLRRLRILREWLVRYQQRHFTPDFYVDLFDHYRPDMVIASTPGWRYDRYILRAAAAQGIKTAAVIVGWDNSSSYSLPGGHVDHITCWSEQQKQELIHGSDWQPEQVHIGGIPSYDGYFNSEWVMPKHEYFKLHGLDPQRKLIAYASSFITFSPNLQNVEALAELVSGDDLVEPSQLLVRLHPNHFMDVERFAEEREAVRQLVRENPHVHLVEPVALGGELGHYSGEDMPEKSSFMAYSDVFVTVYSTMVVEASAHGRPVVSAVLDSPAGWPGKFTLPLSRIGGWPTHKRFIDSGAGRVAHDKAELAQALNYYLAHPDAETDQRRAFIARECTHTDGSAGKRTGDYLLRLLETA